MTVVIGLAMIELAAPARSQETPGKQAYVPGLGEFMSAIQLRHAKLWFAGQANNWELADYELDEMKEVLEDAAKFNPNYKKLPIAAMIKANMETPLADLAKAIGAKDSSRFAKAFDVLTEACNTCHAGTQRGFIRMQRPTAPPVSNQVFAPARK